MKFSGLVGFFSDYFVLFQEEPVPASGGGNRPANV